MNTPNPTLFRFFKVMVSPQAYLNLLYLLAAFPLGLFYFCFLVCGLSLGAALTIVWVGVPILLLVGAGWWALASFERFMAIHLLKEGVPAMHRPPVEDAGIWRRCLEYLTNPVTWKGLLYLFLKFPLGMVTFVTLVVLIALTLALVSLPFTYQSQQFFQGGFLSAGRFTWQVDSLGKASLGALVGLLLWPLSLTSVIRAVKMRDPEPKVYLYTACWPIRAREDRWSKEAVMWLLHQVDGVHYTLHKDATREEIDRFNGARETSGLG